MTKSVLWNVDWILRATGGHVLAGPPGIRDVDFPKISTDSRTIGADEIFVPLDGPQFDGHDYISDAVQKGASCVLVRRGFPVHDVLAQSAVFIEVDDTLKALGDLAHAHRMAHGIPVVAITGSTGKTTTKDMLGEILMHHYAGDVLVTAGNFNNLIGLPLTVFGLRSRHRAAVLEMGMNMRGEIRRLAEIARPEIGIITNVSEAHMEHLQSIGAIAQAKRELLENFGADKIAVLNADDERVAAMAGAGAFRAVTFGVDHPADATAENITALGFDGIRFLLRIGGETAEVTLSCVGRHNVMNALAAALAASELRAPMSAIVAGLEAFRSPAMRMRILDVLRVKVLDDSYNANPKSMDAALATLKELAEGGRQIVVVGDMKELGPESPAAHRRLGRHAAKNGAAYLFALGDFAEEVVAGAREEGMAGDRAIAAENHEAIVETLRDLVKRGDVVLVKGSRAVRMDCVVRGLKGEMY
ncbi:MAG: UDP-N-acetylmuramoyl-tripeptide--D-alanyl-D-alanine ligase [Deltaproteobacteria bacterium]|nr:UDP-N-acetylmuramoyl-tripeptide--D-alanyl-D-alanine ligase [Deltaproteobacteria bacterium]